jgi:hypothetical protein
MISNVKSYPFAAKRQGTLSLLSLLIVGLWTGNPRAQAQLTSIWLGNVVTGTGNWSTGLWDIPPQPGFNVVINNVLFPSVVTLDVNATVNQLTLGTGATLIISNSHNLQLSASSTINGTLNLNSTGGATELKSAGTAVTLSGSGTIVMSANASNHIRGGSSTGFINQLTITGSGSVGDGQMNFTNQGSIIATNASVPLVIDPNGTGFINTGTLKATNGATLEIRDRTVVNSGGLIVAENNSHVDLNRATLQGGTLTSTGTGHFHGIDAFLSGVTITAGSTIELSDGKALTLLGNILNNGTLSLIATSGSNELRFDGSATLSGAGNITLSDASSNRISSGSAGSTLTLGAQQTILGAGEVGRNNLAITNQGTIWATGANALVLDNASSTFTNNGTLKASGSGGMSIKDPVTNLGTIEIMSGSSVIVEGAFTQSAITSSTKLAGGTFTSTGFSLQNGSIAGSGTINGPVTATSGAVYLGGIGSVGALAFTSTLNLGSGSSLFFDLGGTAPGTGHDRLNGTTIALNGSLSLAFVNGFQSTITSNDTLTLINASSALSGTFASLPNGSRLTTTDGFGSFQVNYLANSLTISNFQAIPEPSTYALLGVGAFGVLIAQRRRRQKQGGLQTANGTTISVRMSDVRAVIARREAG